MSSDEIERVARAIVSELVGPNEWKEMGAAEIQTACDAARAALSAMRPVSVDRELEFAWTREGEILVGYNPRSEEGGWVRVGVVTKAVSKLEAERDEALTALAGARQMIHAVRHATGDVDEAPKAISAMRPVSVDEGKLAEIRERHEENKMRKRPYYLADIWELVEATEADREWLLSAIEGVSHDD